ncbi:MAG: type II restriction endonuclease [Elusimicrobiota bacterium]|jgi:type II restriction enzyme|nr:type II restriction endonuclease [Elusimicrobiota bacterium]
MSRDFNKWLSTFQNTNRTFSYWVDFDKVLKNANNIKVELNILNSLIGSTNIKNDFVTIIKKYPECLKCVPFLIAVRGSEVKQIEGIFEFSERIAKTSFVADTNKYVEFMENVGLFDLMENRKIKNLYDYVVGIEVGLDTNARKNRGGNLMSKIVSDYFDNNKIKYETEVYTQDLEKRFGLDLSPITNNGQAGKRFDFMIKKGNTIYGIEVNFYSGGGSKLNETARSYKEIANASKNIKNFKFIWITDGAGWNSAKRNLKETFDILDNLYNIADMKNGDLARLLK